MGLQSLVVSFGLEYEGWHSAVGESSHEKLVFRLRASSFWDKLKLTTGGDLMKMEGYLHLSLQDGPNDTMTVPATEGGDETSIEVLGLLWYLPAYDGSSDGVIRPSGEAFSIECGITRVVFENLRAAIRANEPPQSVHVSIPKGLGLEFGSAPDGSVMKWDNSEKGFLGISGLSFAFSQKDAEEAELVDDAGEEIEKYEEVSESDRMEMIDRSIVTVIQQLTNVRYLLLGVIAAVILARLI